MALSLIPTQSFAQQFGATAEAVAKAKNAGPVWPYDSLVVHDRHEGTAAAAASAKLTYQYSSPCAETPWIFCPNTATTEARAHASLATGTVGAYANAGDIENAEPTANASWYDVIVFDFNGESAFIEFSYWITGSFTYPGPGAQGSSAYWSLGFSGDGAYVSAFADLRPDPDFNAGSVTINGDTINISGPAALAGFSAGIFVKPGTPYGISAGISAFRDADFGGTGTFRFSALPKV
ncbi:hypothetical protein H9L12_11365 [Sphingomonas rhizophila]|uniref:Uncharacterized protein n=1 Tax=Sphingomonas rhizophila TaxID=2071607 RepID=A0A7G9SAF0_9SPHN|nr:hypothetical protein [Sphingomonas rhizophila]QNN64825.1 hypothetical protein H9L12_11365 [Sphingomonas rhizophila]